MRLRLPRLDRGRLLLASRPPAGVVLLAVALNVAAAWQVVADPAPVSLQGVELLTPVIPTLAVYFTAVVIHRSVHPGRLQRRVLLLAGLFMLIATTTVAVIAVTQFGARLGPTGALFAAVLTASIGASVGAPIGIYYDEALTKREALAEEVALTRALNRRLEVVHRVLRHNVRNRLTVAMGHLDEAIGSGLDPTVREGLETSRGAMADLLEHTEKTIRLPSAAPGEQQRTTLDLVPAVTRYLEDLRRTHPELTLRADLPERALVRSHPLLDAAVVEAVENAVEHNDPASLSVAVRMRRSGPSLVVEVEDTGAGIPGDELEALSAPAETPLRHGRGVGLQLMQLTTEASGGSLAIERAEAGGTLVRFTVPAAE